MRAPATIVRIHIALCFAHGSAHTGAGVALGPAGTLFVYIVILASTAVLLVAVEAAGTALGVNLAVRVRRSS